MRFMIYNNLIELYNNAKKQFEGMSIVKDGSKYISMLEVMTDLNMAMLEVQNEIMDVDIDEDDEDDDCIDFDPEDIPEVILEALDKGCLDCDKQEDCEFFRENFIDNDSEEDTDEDEIDDYESDFAEMNPGLYRVFEGRTKDGAKYRRYDFISD